MLRLLEAPDLAGTVARVTGPTTRPPAPAAARRPPRSWRARQWLKNLRDGSLFIPTLARIARQLGLCVVYAELYGRVTHADGSVTDYGLLGRRVITDAGVAYLAADMAGGGSDINALKYHGFGTGTTNESAAHTALVTELTTEYATDNTRPTGSQSASTNTYTTIGTLAINNGGSSTYAITEHGVFSQAAVAGGTLWDRTKFTAINLVDQQDSLQASYVCTFPSGG